MRLFVKFTRQDQSPEIESSVIPAGRWEGKRKKGKREGDGDIFRESVPRKSPPAPPIRFFQTGLLALCPALPPPPPPPPPTPFSPCTVEMPRTNGAAGIPRLGAPKLRSGGNAVEIVCEIASRNYRALLTTPRSTTRRLKRAMDRGSVALLETVKISSDARAHAHAAI